MADIAEAGSKKRPNRPGPLRQAIEAFRNWRNARVADPGFQAWAASFPLTRRTVRKEAEGLYDLVAGFVYSQTLFACVELDLFETLRNGPLPVSDLSARAGLSPDRTDRLMRAAAALDLFVENPDGSWALAQRGAALLGAPGVVDMIRHHALFYRDMADPVALLRGEAEPELTAYWAYVNGDAPLNEDTAASYSRLMAVSQAMVASETLAAVPLTGVRHLIDVGGGEGAFLTAALTATPGLKGTVFDLPPVAERATERLAEAGLADRAEAVGGSFRSGGLPRGANMISLIRVCYDHEDATVRDLLRSIHAALPSGGRLLLSEPMSGGNRPTRSGDAYFGFYTMAMTTGRPRSPIQHKGLLEQAGFGSVREHKVRQPHITRVLTAQKP